MGNQNLSEMHMVDRPNLSADRSVHALSMVSISALWNWSTYWAWRLDGIS